MREVHAVVMNEYGPPEVLTYDSVLITALGPEEVLIRTIASAVNHTDLEIRAGKWPVRKRNPFPYVPGVEVVGDIEEAGAAVRDFRPGDRVITVMQGLGGVRAERPGAYAEYVAVAAAAVAHIPPAVDCYDMASMGLVGVTAYEGLRRLGPLAGRRVIVTGAAGGVGSASTAIAHAQGAAVTGVISRNEHIDYVRSLGADKVIVISKNEPPSRLEPASVDGVLDTVGGDLFARCVEALRPGGTLSLVGAIAGGDVRFDAWQLIRPVTLTGYSSETLDGADLRVAVAALADWLTDGWIGAPAHTTVPLSEASRAHALLEAGGVAGRLLLIP
jgi:NADPH2:quinone reductase